MEIELHDFVALAGTGVLDIDADPHVAIGADGLRDDAEVTVRECRVTEAVTERVQGSPLRSQ